MTNGNGTALMERIKAGSLVTVRMPDGGQLMGRAIVSERGVYVTSVRGATPVPVTPVNIVRVAA